MITTRIVVLLLVSLVARADNYAVETIETQSAVITTSQADTSGPLLTTNHWPIEPGTSERIEFVAHARDPSGVSGIEILVNATVVKQCSNVIECVYTGGPYPAGSVSYAATATDRAGNRSFADYQYITVTAASQPSSGKVKVTVHVLDSHGGAVQGARVDFTNMGTGNPGWRKTGADGQVTYWVSPGTRLRMVPTAAGYRFEAYEATVNAERKYYLKGTKIAAQTACTVRGLVTGARHLAKGIGVFSLDTNEKLAETALDSQGAYGFDHLPAKRVRVLLEVKGKLSPDAEPYFYDLDCRSGGHYIGRNFLLRGVWEG